MQAPLQEADVDRDDAVMKGLRQEDAGADALQDLEDLLRDVLVGKIVVEELLLLLRSRRRKATCTADGRQLVRFQRHQNDLLQIWQHFFQLAHVGQVLSKIQNKRHNK